MTHASLIWILVVCTITGVWWAHREPDDVLATWWLTACVLGWAAVLA